ncbi:MAG: GDSL-type esterase/lipase family protein [Bifidobacterium sp.]|jgi:lysophospholipase L1-like esterase|nr:GDSL-type esterase/lipase family protein [Bifidobacterium sp.]
MPITYRSRRLEAFLTGFSDTEIGPAGGLIAHKVAKRWRDQIRDPSFLWNEMCSSGIHLEMTIETPVTVRIAVYDQYDRRHEVAIRAGVAGLERHREVRIDSRGDFRISPEGDSGILRPAACTALTVSPECGQPTPCTIYLPHTCIAEIVDITSHAPVRPASYAGERLRWTHYGSSISQGVLVKDPTRRWTEQVARRLDLSLRDFSISGNAQMDPGVARAIAAVPADVITCAIGINLVNSDSMRERCFIPALHGFIDVIRERLPATPIVLITACSCPIQEDVPGPTFMNEHGVFVAARRHVDNDAGALTLRRTRELVAQVVRGRKDANLSVVDGRTLLGPNDTRFLADNLHPDEEGTDLIAARAGAMLLSLLRSKGYDIADRGTATS